MNWHTIPYYKLRAKIITDHLDKYPDAGSITIGKILYRDYPEYFMSAEAARNLIRYRRGTSGKQRLTSLKDKKYVTLKNIRNI